jgi:oxygen-independent coproporphyrinogen-3 oxidase
MIDARGIPLALYVHLPWCVRKCPYCDFNSHAVPAGGLAEQAYVDALRRDLELASGPAAGREIVAVFFGGGTPSLFSARGITSVLDHARGLLPFATDVEITLEANPGTVEHGRFADYAAAGVNRVSLGAQSFDEAALAALGRIHGAGDIARAVGELRAAGIDNFNLDLMYALPGQDLRGALEDVERAIALGPAHLSHYQLTLEPGTPFAKRPPTGLPADDDAWAMQVECQVRLAAAGYTQYEVSAYAQAGRRCRHNLVYWEYGDYLGVGAGAHGKVTHATTGAIERTVRSRHPAAYLAAVEPAQRIAETRTVPAADLPFEFCLNALRLMDGFSVQQFESRTGLPRAALDAGATAAQARGLLEWQGDRCRASALGRRFLNDLQAHFLPA